MYKYCKPIFIREREIFAGFVRASSLQVFLAANQTLSYGWNNNTGLYKTYLRKLVVTNQFVSNKLRNNVVVNKSWFTVICV